MDAVTSDPAGAITPARAEVGRLLRNAREHTGLTIRAAARKAGVSDQLWGQTEKGWKQIAPGVYATASTKAEKLAAMALVVGLDPAEILKPLGWTYHNAAAVDAMIAAETVTVGTTVHDPPHVAHRRPPGAEEFIDVGSLSDDELAQLLADLATENARRRGGE